MKCVEEYIYSCDRLEAGIVKDTLQADLNRKNRFQIHMTCENKLLRDYEQMFIKGFESNIRIKS